MAKKKCSIEQPATVDLRIEEILLGTCGGVGESREFGTPIIRNDLKQIRDQLKITAKRDFDVDVDHWSCSHVDLPYISPNHPFLIYEVCEGLEEEPSPELASILCAVACLDKIVGLEKLGHLASMTAYYSVRLGLLLGRLQSGGDAILAEKIAKISAGRGAAADRVAKRTEKRKQDAVAELKRRMAANPRLKKTAALKAMSEDIQDGKPRWGSLRSLNNYCCEVTPKK